MRRGVERNRTLRERWNWHARIVGVGARVWHIICLGRAHVGIVDKSRVLRRGVCIELGKSRRAQQLYDAGI
jgi:hypothetical protein